MSHFPPGDDTPRRLAAIDADIVAGRLHQATAALNALYASAPHDARVYFAGALLSRAANYPQQEIVCLEGAVQRAPQWPLPFAELARAYLRAARPAEAAAMATHAATLDPGDLALIELAAMTATASGDLAGAERHLRAARALRPTDPAIAAALALGLAKQSRFAEAEPLWREAIAHHPHDPFTLGWLGICLKELGRRAEAVDALQAAVALAPDNESLRFDLALARGETPSTQPVAITAQFFDDYATRFDAHLVERLQYRVPVRVSEIIRQRHPARDISVLDLGCGTGLLAAQLGPVGGAFVGVDVSARMLQQARRYPAYSDLRQGELRAELEASAALTYDYAVANDVFIYVGDLSQVIPAAFAVLRPGGALIFSCETATDAEGALVLRPSKRYAHSRASIEQLCLAAGFTDCTIEAIDLRLDENSTGLPGFIAVASKA